MSAQNAPNSTAPLDLDAMREGASRSPLDVETMRDSARRLLAEDAERPTFDELETLTHLLRRSVRLLIPEVEQAAERQPKDEIPRYCALACVGEARRKLDLSLKLDLEQAGMDARIAYARRLSRVLNALCDHFQNLGGGHS